MRPLFPPRPYASPADLDAMRQLLQAGALANTATYYIHTGDLNWWLFYPPIDEDLFQHTRLWDDPAQPGRILGWMMVDPTWPSFEVFMQPELVGTLLAAEMYAYAEGQAYATAGTGRPMHKLWVAEGDRFQSEFLKIRGYAPASWDTAFECNLAQPIPDPVLPEGYSLRPCLGLPEVEQRAHAQYGAFESEAPMEKYLERFTRFVQTEAYAGALDIVAVAPDGHIGAFCIAWSDAVTRCGHFEPVGTHPDFQRKGLGKALLFGALQRLKELGMTHASVCTAENHTPAVALYQSVGFTPAHHLGLYEKAPGA
jgi:mycothiol synthase